MQPLNNDLVEKTDVSGNGFIELNEMVKAFDEGTLDFTSDSIKDSFDLMKDFPVLDLRLQRTGSEDSN